MSGGSLLIYGCLSFPPFMLRKSGKIAQQRVWDETRAEFESKVPDVKKVFELLDGNR